MNATTIVLGLLGGLALFLYGMQMMSNGLEAAAGDRMKEILEKLTSNRILGVIVGAGITAVIQSSSATTVMVVGFVNSGMMTLRQAVWIIMGANIGTTITGQLIALDVGMMAPMFAFIGVAMVMFIKAQRKSHYIGQILAGLGILFIGMEMMGDAMLPLRESEAFISMMTTFSNPAVGILVGAIFTAIIQSSSASVGILQALASSGLIGLGDAVFVLFGQNIGTCITAVLASLGANRNAKQTTLIHLMFNIIGTIIFTTVCIVTPLTLFMESLTPGNPAAQIANMHTMFNIVTTLILLPLGGIMATAAEKILPVETKGYVEEGMVLKYLKPVQERSVRLGASAIHMEQMHQEVRRMFFMARNNVELAFHAIMTGNEDLVEKEKKKEEYIDFLNKEISQYISKTFSRVKNAANYQAIEEYFLITGNVERIGDHADNICGYVKVAKKDNVKFSEEALSEMQKMRDVCLKAMDSILKDDIGTPEWLSQIAAMEQRIDDMTERYRKRHLERMKAGLCSEEACMLYSELLTDFERIGDHILNIAQSETKIPREA